MKKTLVLLFLFTVSTSHAQLKNGDLVPDLQFSKVLNAPVPFAALSQLKGKIILLEFWATWCGSCLASMPHLKALQAKYPKSLQVIAVTDETASRTAKYLQSKPANFWFAIDTGRHIAKLFPHKLIPHAILLDADGKLVASTHPEAITEKVIDSLLWKEKVHLPEKIDQIVSPEELIKQRFFAADTLRYRFMMESEIKGGPGLSTTWLNDNTFSGRRITCINLSLASLYMLAYGDYPYNRTINETGMEKNEPVYCLDLIVESPGDLLSTLQKELTKIFDLQAKIKPIIKEVQALRIIDVAKFKSIRRNLSGKRTYYSRHGEIDQDAISMSDFAQFIENYGIGKLVVDQTGNSEKLDIKFSFQPENPQSLLEILKRMGLGLTKIQQTVDILVLYKPNSYEQ
jgi:thiol-disulfide isomerase/thioredoxin